jgi:hypothetical protein
MRAQLATLIRVCREVAYGIDSMSAVYHGRRPSVPPYPPPSVFSVPEKEALARAVCPRCSTPVRTPD